jgi:hypothetical protein
MEVTMSERGETLYTMEQVRAAINESVRIYISPVFFARQDAGAVVAISKADAMRLVAYEDKNLHPDGMTVDDIDTDAENFGYLAANGDLYINLV